MIPPKMSTPRNSGPGTAGGAPNLTMTQPTQDKGTTGPPSMSETVTSQLTDSNSASSQQLATPEAVYTNTLQDMATSIRQLQSYMNEVNTQQNLLSRKIVELDGKMNAGAKRKQQTIINTTSTSTDISSPSECENKRQKIRKKMKEQRAKSE